MTLHPYKFASKSALESLDLCPRRAWFSNVARMPQAPNKYAGRGIAFHLMIEALQKGQPWSLASAINASKQQDQEKMRAFVASYPNIAAADQYIRTLGDLAQRARERFDDPLRRLGNVRRVEHTRTRDVGFALPLKTKSDVEDESPAGTIVTDWKTGKLSSHLATPEQLRTKAVTVLGAAVSSVFPVTYREFILDAKRSTPHVQEVTLQIHEVAPLVESYRDRVTHLAFVGAQQTPETVAARPGDACRAFGEPCSFQSMCSVWRATLPIGGKVMTNPWGSLPVPPAPPPGFAPAQSGAPALVPPWQASQTPAPPAPAPATVAPAQWAPPPLVPVPAPVEAVEPAKRARVAKPALLLPSGQDANELSARDLRKARHNLLIETANTPWAVAYRSASACFERGIEKQELSKAVLLADVALLLRMREADNPVPVAPPAQAWPQQVQAPAPEPAAPPVQAWPQQVQAPAQAWPQQAQAPAQASPVQAWPPQVQAPAPELTAPPAQAWPQQAQAPAQASPVQAWPPQGQAPAPEPASPPPPQVALPGVLYINCLPDDGCTPFANYIRPLRAQACAELAIETLAQVDFGKGDAYLALLVEKNPPLGDLAAMKFEMSAAVYQALTAHFRRVVRGA